MPKTDFWLSRLLKFSDLYNLAHEYRRYLIFSLKEPQLESLFSNPPIYCVSWGKQNACQIGGTVNQGKFTQVVL